MNWFILQALWEFGRFDIMFRRTSFGELCDVAATVPLLERATSIRDVEPICRAINLASIWYWKPVLCLQRSFVAVRMLRREGVDARLAIGAQRLPFRAHAWVEVNGTVVNDDPTVQQKYTVLEYF